MPVSIRVNLENIEKMKCIDHGQLNNFSPSWFKKISVPLFQKIIEQFLLSQKF